MTERVDADDLALLTASFEWALSKADNAAEAEAACFDLGWGDLLPATGMQGAAAAFAVLGTTGSAACLLDDVVADALGLNAGPETCVIMPAPTSSAPAGTRTTSGFHIDGLISTRLNQATGVVAPVRTGSGVEVVLIDAARLRLLLTEADAATLDPDRPFRRITGEVGLTHGSPIAIEDPTGSWALAVVNARVALAHQLTAIARWMLDQARAHAVDRVQFDKPIASFQAIRHKMADVLVQIEGASSVAFACIDSPDPVLAAVAKSLAGGAANISATHTQQILAGIGFTTDHQFHRWLKRALVVDVLFGSAQTLPAEVGRALLTQRSAPRLLEL